MDWHLAEASFVIQIQGINFEAAVDPVSDVNLRCFSESVDPDAVANVELPIFFTLAADGADEFSVFGKTMHKLSAVAIDRINVAVRGDRDAGGIVESEFNRRE